LVFFEGAGLGLSLRLGTAGLALGLVTAGVDYNSVWTRLSLVEKASLSSCLS